MLKAMFYSCIAALALALTARVEQRTFSLEKPSRVTGEAVPGTAQKSLLGQRRTAKELVRHVREVGFKEA